MSAYLEIDSNGWVIQQLGRIDPPDLVGPPTPPPEGLHSYVLLSTPIDWRGRSSETTVLKWDDGDLKWLETASIDSLKGQKNAEINLKRESLNTTSFTFQGKAIRCRPLDRSDIDGTNGYVALFGQFPEGWQGGWKAADNSYVSISTIGEWKAFYKAMVDTGNANFNYAQQLKSLLAAAETPEQIAAITWETPIG